MSKRDDLATATRKSLPPELRALFLIPDYWALKDALDYITTHSGPISPSWVMPVLAFGFPVDYVLNANGFSVNPADYKPAADLIVTAKPFQWSAAPGLHGQVGEPFHPSGAVASALQIGAEFSDATGEYELLLILAGEVDMAKASADPRLFGQGRLIPLWFRTALAQQ